MLLRAECWLFSECNIFSFCRFSWVFAPLLSCLHRAVIVS